MLCNTVHLSTLSLTLTGEYLLLLMFVNGILLLSLFVVLRVIAASENEIVSRLHILVLKLCINIRLVQATRYR